MYRGDSVIFYPVPLSFYLVPDVKPATAGVNSMVAVTLTSICNKLSSHTYAVPLLQFFLASAFIHSTPLLAYYISAAALEILPRYIYLFEKLLVYILTIRGR